MGSDWLSGQDTSVGVSIGDKGYLDPPLWIITESVCVWGGGGQLGLKYRQMVVSRCAGYGSFSGFRCVRSVGFQ